MVYCMFFFITRNMRSNVLELLGFDLFRVCLLVTVIFKKLSYHTNSDFTFLTVNVKVDR